MKNQSIWKSNIKITKQKPLDKNIETDILIIGGGIAGLTTAYYLKDTNYKITLIDSQYCGLGITSNSSAKISFAQEDIYHKMNKHTATKYLESQKEGIELIKEIINNNNINCDLEKSPSYLFTTKEEKIKDLKKEEEFYKDNNIECHHHKVLPINFPCKYAISIEENYVFNPTKYTQSLKEIIKNKITIYEKTTATNITKTNNYYEVTANNHKIKTPKVIITTHYPFFTIPLFIPFKTNIESSYLIASIPKERKNFNAINIDNTTHSLRYLTIDNENYLLYITNSHNISNYKNKEELLNKSIDSQNKYLNNHIYTQFTNQDIMTPDHMPMTGTIKDNLYIATGFNTWGMTNGTLSGKIISDIIKGEDNPYIELFNPKRIPSNIPKLISYNLENAKSFISTKIKTNYSTYKDKVKVITENGQKIGIYIDEQGIEHKVLNTCPHLKCSLVFNMEEKNWDCPCHGSKFTYDGNIIYGPSNHNIKYPK